MRREKIFPVWRVNLDKKLPHAQLPKRPRKSFLIDFQFSVPSKSIKDLTGVRSYFKVVVLAPSFCDESSLRVLRLLT